MRAADLARELDIPANQASFHLRQLAKYGLVEEDPDAARDKRDRVWRPTSEHGLMVNLDELEKQPGGKAASAVFRAERRELGPRRRRRGVRATAATPTSCAPSTRTRSG